MSWVMRVTAVTPDKAKHMADIVAGRVNFSYLEAFDADADGGRGKITLTDSLERAQRFDSFFDVIKCWKTQSKTVPLRPDGRPNRPLTAYTAQPVELPLKKDHEA